MSNQTQTPHTPGPWEADYHHTTPQGFPKFVIESETVSALAYLHVTEMGVSKAEIEANARLIAAAPDLLEALEEVDKILYHYLSEVHPLRVKIETALAKAKG